MTHDPYAALRHRNFVWLLVSYALSTVAREAHFGESRLYEVLTAPLGLGGQRQLVDLIREGRDEEVVEAVRSAASG